MSLEERGGGLANGGGSWEVVHSKGSKIKTAASSTKSEKLSRERGGNNSVAQRDHTTHALSNGNNSAESTSEDTPTLKQEPVAINGGGMEVSSSTKKDFSMSDKIGAPLFIISTVDSGSLQQASRSSPQKNASNVGHFTLPFTPERGRAEPSHNGTHTRRGILPIDSLSGYYPTTEQSNGKQLSKTAAPDYSLSSEADWPSIVKSEAGEGGGGGRVWSSIVQKPARALPRKAPKPHPQAVKGAGSVEESDEEEEGNSAAGSKKKKRKKKKKSSSQPAEVERHSNQPLLLELGSMFEALEVKKSSKTVIASGVAPVISPQSKPTNEVKRLPTRSGNILDSTAPITRRGKEREQPKKKRPTALRRVITREKEERRMIREGGDQCDGGEGGEDGAGKPVVKVAESAVSKPPPPAKLTIHNRRFREYCTHLVREEVNSRVELLLSELVRFQDRQYQRDPIKAKAKKRYVCGLREVAKHLKLRRIKCIVVPPNLDKIQSEGGISDMIGQILTLCREQAVPVVFALSRRRLAYVLKKKHKVGSVGIFSYDGAQVHYKHVLELVEQATEDYVAKVTHISDSIKKATPTLSLEDNSSCPDSSNHSNQVHATTPDAEINIGSGSSSEADSDVEPESGNGNQESTQVTSIIDTVWKIFFNEEESNLHGNKEEPIHHHSNTDQNHHGNKDDKPTTDQTLALDGPQQTAVLDTSTHQLNVNAQAFVLPPKFSLNFNAAEFVPSSPE